MADTGVIWWADVCGNQSEEDAFWSTEVTVLTSSPDLTQCFQDTVLVWVGCGWLWLAAPLYGFHLRRAPVRHSWTACGSTLSLLKLVVSLVLAGVSLAQLMNQVITTSYAPLSRPLAYGVYLATYLLSGLVMRWEYRKGKHSSGVLCCFWLGLVVINIVPFRSRVTAALKDKMDDLLDFTLFYVGYFFLLAELGLHFVADKKALVADKILCTSATGERQPLLGEATRAPPDERGSTAQAKLACPEITATFWSRITYTWTSQLMLIGYKKKLDQSKLWLLRPGDQGLPNVSKFFSCWKRSSRTKPHVDAVTKSLLPETGYSVGPWSLNSSLLIALWRCYGLQYTFLVVYEVANIAITFMRPTILDWLIGFVEDPDQYPWQGYLYAALLVFLTVIRALITQLLTYRKMIIALRLRSALTAAVYRKSLTLSSTERKKNSVGGIVNVMSVDAQRIADVTSVLHTLWAAPVNVIVAMAMLWGYLGVSSLAGLGVLLILMVLNIFLASKMKKLQVMQMKFKDKRLKLTNEMFNGIKVLKFHAWEGAFQRKLTEIRDTEIGYILQAAFYVAGSAISVSCAPVLYTVVAFTLFILVSKDSVFSAQVAFVSLSLVNSLTRPLAFLPRVIAGLIQASVSVKRVEDFLNAGELEPTSVQHQVSDAAVTISRGEFSWDPDSGRIPTLRDVNVSVRAGSLNAVVGPVGSGKSSLLSAILGEIYRTVGTVNVMGSIALVAQEPWIRNESVESNVLFGKPMDRPVYDRIIDACALVPDMKILPAGDQTEIGEKGVNLSGGQRQRVALARAVYQNADLYLLDDPLSAVDAHVGAHIFDQVVGPRGLLANKTRILVTHGLTYLPRVDYVIVMKEGAVAEQGTFRELAGRQGGAMADLARTFLGQEDDDERQVGVTKRQLMEGDPNHANVGPKPHTFRRRKPLRRDDSRVEPKNDGNASSISEKEPEKHGRRLLKTEQPKEGGVRLSVLLWYLRTLPVATTVSSLVSYVFIMIFDLGANIWLSEWSKDSTQFGPNDTVDPNLPTLRVGVYGGLGGGKALAVLCQTLLMAVACTTASRVLHSVLLDAIVRAPTTFFDTTPTGRILNRFSQDMNTVDARLRMTLIAVLRGISGLVTTIIAISYTSPIFLAFVVPLAIGYYFVQRFYVMTSNQLRRWSSVRSSPIYSHFAESVMGASTIRAYRKQDEFIQQSDRILDDMQEARFPAIVINRWLTVRLEVLGAFIVLFSSVYAVIARDFVTGGMVGLSISYSLRVTDQLSFFVRNTSDLENNVVAVERIEEYSQVKPEAPWTVEDSRPANDWPSGGHVTFTNYSTRYRPGLDLALEDISCSMRAGERVGIVGRTGAGKSTLTLGLFRLLEPTAGNITIDGIPTSSLGLHDLRSKLTIIPQDPVVFSGSLRFNLDPFTEHGDTDLWQCLDHAHLRQFVHSLPAQLDYECQEGGMNLSAGQRQLVCLARALLRRTKILVLDEATAAVDMETDALIQTALRRESGGCTIITIAHRINTVIDYDRVLVLDRGRVVEYDSPARLMADRSSVFSTMCRDAGVPMDPTLGSASHDK